MRASAWSSVIMASKAVAFSIVSNIISSMDMVRMEVIGAVFSCTVFFVKALTSAVGGVLTSSFVASEVDCCLESSAVVVDDDDIAAAGATSSSSTTIDAPPKRLLFLNQVSSSVSMTHSKESRNSSWDNRVYRTKDIGHL